MLTVTNASGFGSGGVSAYKPDAAIFDGSNDYVRLGANLTGAAHNQDYFFRAALNWGGGDGSSMYIIDSLIGVYSHNWRKGTDKEYQWFSHDNPAVNFGFNLFNSTAITASTGWHHIMMSIDTSASTVHIYLDDADNKGTTTIDDVNNLSAFSSIAVGAASGGGSKSNVSICDIIYAQEFIDISDTATRRNFVNADGTLPDWETALAAVSSPLIAMHLDDGEAAANFADNADGTGQAFTITGTLTSEDGPNG